MVVGVFELLPPWPKRVEDAGLLAPPNRPPLVAAEPPPPNRPPEGVLEVVVLPPNRLSAGFCALLLPAPKPPKELAAPVWPPLAALSFCVLPNVKLLDGAEDCPAVLKRDGAAVDEDDGADEGVFPKLNAMVVEEGTFTQID